MLCPSDWQPGERDGRRDDYVHNLFDGDFLHNLTLREGFPQKWKFFMTFAIRRPPRPCPTSILK